MGVYAETIDFPSAPVESAQACLALPGIVGASARLMAAAAQVPLIAESDATCVLQGETGTGKELFARAIHYSSARKHRAFVPVNCGAIPDQLFENELFGHVRGAYTDAKSNETGLFAFAENGTLFLDEVDALSPSAQVKMLRVLQEREYRPIGSARTYATDVRILAASNCDLQERVAARRFREDLFHRLNILRLRVPPLRERMEDIPMLTAHFLKMYAAQYRRQVKEIAAMAIGRLMSYHWPGNIRELQGVLERAVLLVRGPSVSADDLDMPEATLHSPHQPTLKAAKTLAITQFERAYLSDVLKRCGGNVSRAAKAAGKERSSFQRLLRKYRITVTSFQTF